MKDSLGFPPGVQGITTSIAKPNAEVHNFKHKLTLISMVRQAQFGCDLMKDPNLYCSVFSEVCDTLKLNRVLTDAI